MKTFLFDFQNFLKLSMTLYYIEIENLVDSYSSHFDRNFYFIYNQIKIDFAI